MVEDMLKKWFSEFRYGNWDRDVLVTHRGYFPELIALRFQFCTDVNTYKISASIEPESGKSYLGCIATSRKTRAGEDHLRGNDLSDGPLDYRTWCKILQDIVSYEMVGIFKPKDKVKGNLV
jgi:hypothetical protein